MFQASSARACVRVRRVDVCVCVLAEITGRSFIHEREPTSDFKASRGAPFLNSSHSRVRAVDALRSPTNLTAPREP